MKGYRFYEELDNKNRKAEMSKGNVVAVLLQENGRGWSPLYAPDGTMEAIGAAYYHKNSPVASTGVSMGYLRDACRRVTEKRAREIHPLLFEYLDS